MEELKKLLGEWKKYKAETGNVPNRILEPELVSIANSVDFTLRELNGKGSFEVTNEEQKVIGKIYNFLKQRASNT